MIRTFTLILAVLVSSLLHCEHLDLDTSFGSITPGIELLSVGGVSAINAVTTQTIGTQPYVIGVGSSDDNAIVVRYEPDGGLDTATPFATAGIYTESAVGFRFVANGVAIDASNNIIVAGTRTTIATGLTEIFLRRLDPNGAPLSLTITAIDDGADGSDVDVDTTTGQIAVAGSSILSGVSRIALVRYTSAGAFSGTTSTPNGEGAAAMSVFVDQFTNEIYVGGWTRVSNVTQTLVGRYTAAGALDGTYGTAGLAANAVGSVSQLFGIIVDSLGQVVGAGNSDDQFLAVRLLANGSALDPAFGGGSVTTALTSSGQATDVAEQLTGEYVTVGFNDTEIALVQYTTAGALDTNFGTGGIITTPIGAEASANSVTIQEFGGADPRVLVGGISDEQGAFARYNPTNAPTIHITVPGFGTTLTTPTSVISGSASETNTDVEIEFNGTGAVVATATTDSQGLWTTTTSPIFVIPSTTILANLLSTPPASVTQTNTVTAAEAISVTTPANDSTIVGFPDVVGESTRASTNVDVSIDGGAAISASTDAAGRWNIGPLPLLSQSPPVHTVNATLTAFGPTVSPTNNFTVLGTLARSDYAFATLNSTTVLGAAFAAINFDSTPIISGWTYSAGTFTCPSTGTYLFHYTGTAARSAVGTFEDITIRVFVNGAEVPGSQIATDNENTGIPEGQIIASYCISDCTAGDSVQVQARSQTGVGEFIQLGTTNPSVATATIVRLR